MATTTPNFGWAVPTSSDLVKNGATAIETLGDSIDASLVDLKGGTTGQVLKKATNTDMDFVWSADSAGMTNPMTTTGDTIYSSSGSTPARLGIGSTGQVLTVAGGLPSWATPSAGGASGPAFFASKTGGGTQAITSGTWTKITYNTEAFDTDNCFASSRFTPTKAGYYQINLGNQLYSSSGSWLSIAAIYKNGSAYATNSGTAAQNYFVNCVAAIVYFNGSSDYVEGYALGTGTSPEIIDNGSTTIFNGVWIRS